MHRKESKNFAVNSWSELISPSPRDARIRPIPEACGNGLAQAIAGNPRLIIVDEPTAGLDPEERLRFYYLLAELAEKRIVILSTHILEDVAVLCPRFTIIRHGRLVAQLHRTWRDRALTERFLRAQSRLPSWKVCLGTLERWSLSATRRYSKPPIYTASSRPSVRSVFFSFPLVIQCVEVREHFTSLRAEKRRKVNLLLPYLPDCEQKLPE